MRYLATEFLPQRGVQAQFVDMADTAAVQAACVQPLALLWMETPSNPLITVCDIAALARIAQAQGALAVRSEEHTSELQSIMRKLYSVFCCKQNTITNTVI